MTTIDVLMNEDLNNLSNDIEACLKTLYTLENMTDYQEKAISNCIDFLQQLEINSIEN